MQNTRTRNRNPNFLVKPDPNPTQSQKALLVIACQLPDLALGLVRFEGILHVYVVTTLWMRLAADLILLWQASANNLTIKWSSPWASHNCKCEKGEGIPACQADFSWTWATEKVLGSSKLVWCVPPQKSPLQGEWLAQTLCVGRIVCGTLLYPLVVWGRSSGFFLWFYVVFMLHRALSAVAVQLGKYAALLSSPLVWKQGGIWRSLWAALYKHSFVTEGLTRDGGRLGGVKYGFQRQVGHVLAFRSGTYKNPKSECNHM